MCPGRVCLVECGRLSGSCRLGLTPSGDPATTPWRCAASRGHGSREGLQRRRRPEQQQVLEEGWPDAGEGSSLEKGRARAMKARPLVPSQGLGCSGGALDSSSLASGQICISPTERPVGERRVGQKQGEVRVGKESSGLATSK